MAFFPSSPTLNQKATVFNYQALRDITSQAEFPYNATWPTKPV